MTHILHRAKTKLIRKEDIKKFIQTDQPLNPYTINIDQEIEADQLKSSKVRVPFMKKAKGFIKKLFKIKDIDQKHSVTTHQNVKIDDLQPHLRFGSNQFSKKRGNKKAKKQQSRTAWFSNPTQHIQIDKVHEQQSAVGVSHKSQKEFDDKSQCNKNKKQKKPNFKKPESQLQQDKNNYCQNNQCGSKLQIKNDDSTMTTYTYCKKCKQQILIS